MVDFNLISDLIKGKLNDAKVEIQDLTGTGDHLGLLVVSDQFEGKMVLDQHKVVMEALEDQLKQDLHAVKIKTMTYKKYSEHSQNS